jgi:hypothetical protein
MKTAKSDPLLHLPQNQRTILEEERPSYFHVRILRLDITCEGSPLEGVPAHPCLSLIIGDSSRNGRFFRIPPGFTPSMGKSAVVQSGFDVKFDLAEREKT